MERTFAGSFSIGRIAFPTAGLVTTIIFCLAHVNLSNPGQPRVNWTQQLWAFGLGTYYSAVYYRTRSLLNPILAHNWSNGSQFLITYAAHCLWPGVR